MTAPPDPRAVETPVGYVDLERVRANVERVAAYAAEHDLAWRPHIKTHKSRRLARLQLEAGAGGLTVATPREAEVMASLTDDLLLAYPPVGASKLERILALPESVDLKVALDSAEALDGLARAAEARGRTVGVLVELDVGLGRVGLPGAEAVVALARRAAAAEGVAYRGVLFYPGHIRMPANEQGEGLAQVTARLRETLDALADAGLGPGIVSGGSTPTLFRSHEIPGMTEIRSGSCVFYDIEGVEVGAAGLDDVGYSVLATVVSTAVPGRAVVDAGAKALGKEARGGEGGFGVVMEHPEVRMRSLSEEHGVLDVSATEWTPRVGERVRVIPNHVCLSVNLQDALLAADGDAHTLLEVEGRGRGPWSG